MLNAVWATAKIMLVWRPTSDLCLPRRDVPPGVNTGHVTRAGQFLDKFHERGEQMAEREEYKALLYSKFKDQEWIQVQKLAPLLGFEGTSGGAYCLRWLKKHGFANRLAQKITPNSRGHYASCLNFNDAAEVLDLRQKQGGRPRGGVEKKLPGDRGYFYVCQLMPELDPKRVKLGFVTDVALRLEHYRTTNPSARMIKTWPCRKLWKQAVMDAITGKDCLLVASEVFECDNVEALIERGDQFLCPAA